MPSPLWSKAGKFHQVGIVVADLDSAIASMSTALGVPSEEWEVLASGDKFDHYENGSRVDGAKTRYARAQTGATVYQLIQPLAGDTVWRRWLDTGKTVFAVGYYVRDRAASEAELVDAGGKVLAQGVIAEGDQIYDYSFVELPGSDLVVELMAPAAAA